jgi:DNA-binding CsgD family transcriptional regulator
LISLQAGAEIGLRRFSRASSLIDALVPASRRPSDYLDLKVQTMRCKLYLVQNKPHEVEIVAPRHVADVACRGQYGEYIAALAIVLASTDRFEKAIEFATYAERTSSALEGVMLARWARAITSIRCYGPAGEAAVATAFDRCRASGEFDSAVLAYRAEPDILRILSRNEEFRPILDRLLTAGRDQALARMVGLSVERDKFAADGSDLLSKREREVYALLATGKPNREIARVLFISEATVKVHVRNILRKLKSHTRTEAAVRSITS